MNILITGSRSGIGLNTGIELLKRGHYIYFTVHRNTQVKTLLDKLKELNISTNYSVFKLDITDEKDRNQLYDLDIDVLINNASIGVGGSILDLDIKKIRENFEVNLFSNIEMIKTYHSSLNVNNKKGRVLVLSSLAGIISLPFMGSYCSTKASLISLVTSLKRELSLIDANLDIALIEPGIYVTGFNEAMIDNKCDSSLFNNIYHKVTYYKKKLFKIFGRKDLASITKKIVKAVECKKLRLKYRAPFIQVLCTKLYMMIFK